MTEFILIIFVCIGAMSDKDSMALTSVAGFKSQQECKVAGEAAAKQFGGGTKRAEFVCVAQKQ